MDDGQAPGWAGRVMVVLRWVEHLVLAQVLVVLGTLAGGVVLGLFPALDAAGRLVARLPAGDPSTRPWREFWSAWRTGWRRDNVLGAPLWVVGALVALDARIASLAGGPVRAGLVVGVVVVGAWFAVVLAYLPPVLRRYDDSAARTWRFLLLAPALSPGTALAILVTAAVVGVTAWFVPAAGALVGVAVLLLACGWLVDVRLDAVDGRAA